MALFDGRNYLHLIYFKILLLSTFKLINLTRIIAHWRQFFAGKYPFIYPTGNRRLSRRSILFGRKSWNMHLYVLFILQRTENGNANAKLTTKCMRHYRANWTSLDRKSMDIFNVGIVIFLPVYLAPTFDPEFMRTSGCVYFSTQKRLSFSQN